MLRNRRGDVWSYLRPFGFRYCLCIVGALLSSVGAVAHAQTWTFGDYQGHDRRSSIIAWPPFGSQGCLINAPAAMDSDLYRIRNNPLAQARVATLGESAYAPGGVNDNILSIFDAGLVVTPDASLLGDDEELEEMANVQLPDTSSVALAMAWGASLPLVGDYGSTNEDAIFVLEDDGEVHVFAREGSGILSAFNLPWPAGYEYAGTLAPPSLSGGTTVRHYCDIEVLFDGDIIVTFAQNPNISLSGFPYLTEGYIRYDHATSSWETPVTTIGGFTLAHPEKYAGFDREQCLSVDYNRNLSMLGFASNNGSLPPVETPRVWRVSNTGSGAFPFWDVGTVPSGSGYIGLADVALLDDDFVLVQHSNSGIDSVQIFEVATNSVISTALMGVDMRSTSVSEVNDGDSTCKNWIAFTSSNGNNGTYPMGDECASFFSIPIERCP